MDEYQRFVARRIVDGVRRAHNQLRPAHIAWGSVQAPEHVFNRRWHMKPGSTIPTNPFGGMDKVKMNPPAGHADLLEPAGPTDPEIPFIALREPPLAGRASDGGKWLAVFSAYSLHYVGGVGPGHISADYFGMYCATLAKLLKADASFVALMANGTSGDINNINFKSPRGKKQPYEQMQFVADDVAQKVHAGLAKLKFREHVTLAARYDELPIATRRPDAKLLEWAQAKLKEPRVKGKSDLPTIYAERALRMAEHPEKLKLPLQAFRIGDLGIATMPCEIFCEIGLEMKKKSPLRPTFMISLNHGYYGYLPTPKHHELGGYETWLGTNRLEVRASEKMSAKLREMLSDLAK
jgi:hypothetical protein